MTDKRLIDANALLKSYDVAWMVEYDETGCGVDRKAIPTKTIEEAPTIDAVEVVHGRWVYHQGMFVDSFSCSVCGSKQGESWMNYCPNFGAKMDVTDNNVGHKDGGADDA